MTTGCSNVRLAIEVKSGESVLLFNFHNDDIAKEFAMLNNAI